MTQDDVRALLVKRAGPRGMATWCKAHGVSQGFASDFIKGNKDAGKLMLDALGLEIIIRRKRSKLTCNQSPSAHTATINAGE